MKEKSKITISHDQIFEVGTIITLHPAIRRRPYWLWSIAWALTFGLVRRHEVYRIEQIESGGTMTITGVTK